MKAKLGIIALITALAILAAVMAAPTAGGPAFRTTLVYENNTVQLVGPDGRLYVLKPIMKGGEVKVMEIRLLPNGTLILVDHGKVWAKVKPVKTAGQINETALATTAERRPNLIKAVLPISGTLEPYSAHLYGPYTGLINIEFNASWSSTGYLC